ncbi:MAG: hypothetical protein GY861_17370 [bacterium]|nr:hypothetical protein [bacterium]
MSCEVCPEGNKEKITRLVRVINIDDPNNPSVDREVKCCQECAENVNFRDYEEECKCDQDRECTFEEASSIVFKFVRETNQRKDIKLKHGGKHPSEKGCYLFDFEVGCKHCDCKQIKQFIVHRDGSVSI